jgi:hypothetical protein
MLYQFLITMNNRLHKRFQSKFVMSPLSPYNATRKCTKTYRHGFKYSVPVTDHGDTSRDIRKKLKIWRGVEGEPLIEKSITQWPQKRTERQTIMDYKTKDWTIPPPLKEGMNSDAPEMYTVHATPLVPSVVLLLKRKLSKCKTILYWRGYSRHITNISVIINSWLYDCCKVVYLSFVCYTFLVWNRWLVSVNIFWRYQIDIFLNTQCMFKNTILTVIYKHHIKGSSNNS